jgi:hypothetical protein
MSGPGRTPPHLLALSRRLPCGHQSTRGLVQGTITRVCRTCRRAFRGELVRSPVSASVGSDVWRVEWTEVTP